jgi:hypothetical protein
VPFGASRTITAVPLLIAFSGRSRLRSSFGSRPSCLPADRALVGRVRLVLAYVHVSVLALHEPDDGVVDDLRGSTRHVAAAVDGVRDRVG